MRLEQREGSDNSLAWYGKAFCFLLGATGSHHRISDIECMHGFYQKQWMAREGTS